MSNALTDAISRYPFLQQMGFADLITSLAQQGVTDPATVYAEVRKTPNYAMMFPGIIRPDGTLRMDEQAYLRRQDEYRQVLQSFGRDPARYGPNELSAFFDANIDPNELKDRFTLYENVNHAGSSVKAAFHVYAGMNMSQDDLYRYLTNPLARNKFNAEYEHRTSVNPIDYQTFITRATEVGLDSVVSALQSLQANGTPVDAALSVVRNLDPAFARQLADILYTTPGDIQLGSLQQLQSAFQVALIGGAASQVGLVIPDRARVDQIRAAGITRVQALEKYGTYAVNQFTLQGAVQRLNRGIGSFTQSDFEKAVFLHDTPSAQLMQQAQAVDAASGAKQGQASFGRTKTGIAQAGLGPAF